MCNSGKSAKRIEIHPGKYLGKSPFSALKDAREKGRIVIREASWITIKFAGILVLSRQPKWSEDETVCARSVTNEVHCFHDADFSMYPVHNIASFQLIFIGANSNLDKVYWLILNILFTGKSIFI